MASFSHPRPRGRRRIPFATELLEPRRVLSAGDLDVSFGGDGKVTTDFPASAYDRGYDVVTQPDGRYVVAGQVGSAFFPEDAGFAFARYNADGTPDLTFGAGGRVVVPFGRSGGAAAVALAPGGKIVAAGVTSGVGQDVAAVRLNPDGSLDMTFDGDGRQTVDFDGRRDEALELVVDAVGRVVVVGQSAEALAGGTTDTVLARLRTDGTLDPTFDGDGRLSLSVPGGTVRARALALDSVGRILAAGDGRIGAPNQTPGGFVVVRLGEGGALDPSFGAGGAGYAPVSPAGAVGNDVATDAAGRILVAGNVPQVPGRGTEAGVARFRADGSLDADFGGGDGVGLVGLADRNDTAAGAAVDAAGNILLVGRSDPSGTGGVGNFAVFRLDPSGAPDAAFDSDGAWLGAEAWSEARGAVAAPGGTFVVAGEVRPGGEDLDFLLGRFDARGPDASFGTGGFVATDFTAYAPNRAAAMAVQPDGKVVVGGTTPLYPHWDFQLVRYRADGSPDASFGEGGVVVSDLAGTTDVLNALAVQADGKILAAGSTFDPAADGGHGKSVFAVARYTSDGRLDAAFGTGGFTKVEFLPAESYYERPYVLAVQPDGRIVVAGDAGGQFALTRLSPAGALDATFGTGGKVLTRMREPGMWGGWGYVTGLALGPGGTIVAAGPTGSDFFPPSTFGLVRYDALGRPDPTFGQGGRLEASVPGSDLDVKVVVDAGGRIVVGTTTSSFDIGSGRRDQDFALVRFLPDGTRDEYFGGYDPGPDGFDPDLGVVATDFNGGNEELHALLMLPDGSLVAAGAASFGAAGGAPDFGVARFDADGNLLADFGDGGRVTTDFAGYPDVATSAALGPDGRLVVAGWAVVPGRAEDFAVARYELADRPIDRWVVGAQLFYNDSAFDGRSAGLDEADDAAVATDKRPLMPVEGPTFDNVTSYSKGINGVMFDVADRPGTTVLWSARYTAGPDLRGGDWLDAAGAARADRPSPAGARLRRYSLAWPDGMVRNAWLEVTVDVYDGDRRLEHAVFTFGNLAGETGDDLRVNALDLASVKRALNTTSDVRGRQDVNRDGRVNALDLAAVRQNLGRALVAGTTGAVLAAPVASAPAPLEVGRVWREEE